MFLLAALASEVAAGVINGQMSNSTLTFIPTILTSLCDSIVYLVLALPVMLLNFVLSILSAVLGLPIPQLMIPGAP